MRLRWNMILFALLLGSGALCNADSTLSVWRDNSKADTVRLKALEHYFRVAEHKDPHYAHELATSMYELASKAGSDRFRSLATYFKGMFRIRTGQMEEGMEELEEALTIATHIPDSALMIRILERHGFLLHDQGQYTKAIGSIELALAIAEAIEERELMMKILSSYANLKFHKGEFESALEDLGRCMTYYVETGDKKGMSTTHSLIAHIHMHRTDLELARDHLLKGYTLARELGDEMLMARNIGPLAQIHQIQGDLAGALNHLLLEEKILTKHDRKRPLAANLKNIGQIHRDLGDLDRAMDMYVRSRELYVELGISNGTAWCDEEIGHLLDRMGRTDEALVKLRAAFEAYGSGGDTRNLAGPLIKMGDIHRRQGRIELARERLQKGLYHAEQLRNRREMALAMIHLGWLEMQTGATTKAREMGEMALLNAIDAGAAAELRDASALLYEVYKKLRQMDKALVMHEQFVRMRDSLQNVDMRNELIRMDLLHSFEKRTLADSLAFAAAQARKESEIREQQADMKKQRIALFASISGLVLIVLLAFAIHRGKKQSDGLLLNILPYETAQELKRKGHAEARLIEEVTVLFTDFKGFTELAERLSPQELVAEINTCFSAFDRIMEKHGIEKIKTIGDAYMAAGGMPTPTATHAIDTVKAGLEIQHHMYEQRAIREAEGRPYFDVRIGIHTGPVVAGIVGIKKFQYDIWGDTVNVASRMESNSEVGRVNISEATYQLVKDHFACTYRGEVPAKGKGSVRMYFIEGPLDASTEMAAELAQA